MKYDSKVEENIFRILKDKEIEFEVIKHEAVYTCDVAAKVAGHEINAGIKSIIMKSKPSGKYFLVCLPGGKRIDNKRMQRITNSKSIRFSTAEEVKELTGLTIGSCCPFGYDVNIRRFIDKDLYDNEYLYFNPGSHIKTIKLRCADFKKLVKGVEF